MMDAPFVAVRGIGIDVTICVEDELDAEIVRMAINMAAKRAAAKKEEGQ